MRQLSVIVMFGFLLFLSGCTEKLNEFKEAALEIDTVADKAANAISLDAHTIRDIELEYNDKLFTINDLFKTILRDVQWEYDETDNIQKLIVKGKRKPPLFESYISTDSDQYKLDDNTKITIEIEFIEGQLKHDSVSFSMILADNIVIEEKGEEAYSYLVDYYTSLKK